MGTSQGQRLILWSMSLREIAESPWVGVGPGHIREVIHGYCSSHLCSGEFLGFNQVHMQYLDSFLNAGIFGLLGLFVSFLGPLFFFLSRFCRGVEAGRIAAIAGVAVVLAAMTSALSQALYAHSISVISYFFTIAFLWFLATPDLETVSLLAPPVDQSKFPLHS